MNIHACHKLKYSAQDLGFVLYYKQKSIGMTNSYAF